MNTASDGERLRKKAMRAWLRMTFATAACATVPVVHAQAATAPSLDTPTTYSAAGQAVTYATPAGANVVTFSLKGAGGGFGGDDSAWGGNGGPGSQLSGRLQIVPGLGVQLTSGGPGQDGVRYFYGVPSTANPTANPNPGGGGAGGLGAAPGGNGGNVGISNSGGGGGGGGASVLSISGPSVNMLSVLAGGGGGGGGGSSRWSIPGNPAHTNKTGATVTVVGVPVPDGNYVVNYGNYGPANGTLPSNFTSLFLNPNAPGAVPLGIPYALTGGTQFKNRQANGLPALLNTPHVPDSGGSSLLLYDYTIATRAVPVPTSSNANCANSAYPSSATLAGMAPPVSFPAGDTTGGPTGGTNGGGGGGTGGTYAGQTHQPAHYGIDNQLMAEGGPTGASCYAGYAETGDGASPSSGGVVFLASGGGAGGIHSGTAGSNAAVPAVGGNIVLTFSYDASRVPTIAAIQSNRGALNVTVSSPVTLPPNQTPGSYAVTCTSPTGNSPLSEPAAPANGSGGAAVTLPNATPGATYTCTATASLVDSGTHDSTIPTLPSPPAQATVPTQPAIASTNSGDGQGWLSITPPGNLPDGVLVSSYTAICQPGDITATGGVSLHVTGLTNGTAYTCAVVANLSDGTTVESSNTGTLAPQAIIPPSITGTTSGDTRGTLSYSPISNLPTHVTVTGYSTVCNPGGATASGASPMNVTGLTNGTVYTCTVSAHLSDGSSVPSSNTGTIAPQSITAPVITATTSGDAKGALTTITPPGNLPENVTVSNYTATCTPGNISVTGHTPLEITGLTNGTTYSCTVIATLSDGSKTPVSTPVELTPKAAGAVVATPVPTLSEWGVVLLVSLALLAGMFSLRRRARD